MDDEEEVSRSGTWPRAAAVVLLLVFVSPLLISGLTSRPAGLGWPMALVVFFAVVAGAFFVIRRSVRARAGSDDWGSPGDW